VAGHRHVRPRPEFDPPPSTSKDGSAFKKSAVPTRSPFRHQRRSRQQNKKPLPPHFGKIQDKRERTAVELGDDIPDAQRPHGNDLS